MGIESLPEPIRKRVMSVVDRDKEYEDNRISVTELTRCLRKSYFIRKLGEEIGLQQAWYFYRGILFDEDLTSRFPKNQIRITHRIRNTPILISGRLDFIYEGAVWDLKTTDGLYFVDRDGAKTEHIEQVKFYAVNEALNKAALCYISLGGASIFEFDISPEEAEEITETFEKRAKDLYTSLTNNSPPERDEGRTKAHWECKLCQYADKCYNETGTDQGLQ